MLKKQKKINIINNLFKQLCYHYVKRNVNTIKDKILDF